MVVQKFLRAGVESLAVSLNTPGIKQLWHGYLGSVLGLDLAAIGKIHKGDRNFYKSWEEVEVPCPADFIGADKSGRLDLTGTWQMHEDTEHHGVKQEWFNPEKAPKKLD